MVIDSTPMVFIGPGSYDWMMGFYSYSLLTTIWASIQEYTPRYISRIKAQSDDHIILEIRRISFELSTSRCISPAIRNLDDRYVSVA